MAVSQELLCSFELLKPLDSNALKSHIKKSRNKRNQLLNSPVSLVFGPVPSAIGLLMHIVARKRVSPECVSGLWNAAAISQGVKGDA